MSDKEEKKRPAEPTADGAPAAEGKKGGLPIKMIGIMGAIMIAEAVGVFMFVSMTGKAPHAAEAKEVEGAGKPDLESSVEIQLLEDKFQNMQTGRVWVWDTAIVLKVREKNKEFVSKALEKSEAEIKEGVSLIFRKAPHTQLKEPGLETVNRQVLAYMNQLLGKDAEQRDRVERVLIPKCKGFPAD